MAELRATKQGLATEIADAAGEFHDYALRRLSPRAYQVTREDTGESYTVLLCDKTWTCSCRAFEFRNSRTRVHLRGTCKHCVTVEGIHEVLQAITQGVPAHDPR